MVNIVSPSEISGHLTRLFDTLDKSSEYAADVANALAWLESFEAINLDRLAKFVKGSEDFALSLTELADKVRERVYAAYGKKTPEHWQVAAIGLGWEIREADPSTDRDTRVDGGPLFYHPDLDRVWPLSDPEGACMDLGMREDGTFADD